MQTRLLAFLAAALVVSGASGGRANAQTVYREHEFGRRDAFSYRPARPIASRSARPFAPRYRGSFAYHNRFFAAPVRHFIAPRFRLRRVFVASPFPHSVTEPVDPAPGYAYPYPYCGY